MRLTARRATNRAPPRAQLDVGRVAALNTFPFLVRRPAGAHGKSPDPYNELWIRAKTIDGYPENEWTFTVFVKRVQTLAGFHPFLFYEDARSWADTLEVIRHMHILKAGGVRDGLCPGVALGMRFYDSGFTAPEGRLPSPSPSVPFRGRHNVMITGALTKPGDSEVDAALLIFRNSWGPDWGDRGYGYISREYFEEAVESVIVTWPGELGFSPANREALRALNSSRSGYVDALAKVWLMPSMPTLEIRAFLDRPHELWHWRLYSLTSDRWVTVIQIHNGLRGVGRAHVFVDGQKASIEELFIWPSLRRRGYGRILESLASGVAADAGCWLLTGLLREADAQPRQRAISESFGSALGYAWTDTPSTRPNIVATASRQLNSYPKEDSS
jgi:GNAT superfamily N-acetyltransferase